MTPERWAQIKVILGEVLDRPASERPALLDSLCGGDADLRAEVEVLLTSHAEADDFLEASALHSARSSASDDTADREPATGLKPGDRVGAYQVVRKLGSGGMGEVYLAERADNEFHQRVALKLIRFEAATDILVRRFRHERQILASLDHPHIAKLLDGGRTSDGRPYFVMEYLSGQPLNQHCDDLRLEIRARVTLFSQVCDAVAHAHSKQIVHRDIKPNNILVAEGGAPKLLDFGIAKILDAESDLVTRGQTATAMRMMTPDYASPEQLHGQAATTASDVYSLGIVLYELLCGRHPLRLNGRGRSPSGKLEPPSAVIDQVQVLQAAGRAVTISPETVSELRSCTPEQLRRQLTGSLDRVIAIALDPDPERRYPSAAELALDLRRYLDDLPLLTSEVDEGGAGTEVLSGSPGAFAVLPFQMIGHETTDAYLGIGLTDALISKLAAMRRLVVRPTSAVLVYSQGGYDLSEVGRRLDVEHVLDGRIRCFSERVRVTVQLVHCASRRSVWAAQCEEKLTDLLQLEDSLSQQVAQAVMPRLTAPEQELLNQHQTENPDAYRSHLKGRYHWNSHHEEGLAQALVCFQAAIAIDPHYAAPYAGVADYHLTLGLWSVLPPRECFAAAQDAATRALELDATLAEAQASQSFANWLLQGNGSGEAELSALGATGVAVAGVYHWLALIHGARGRHAEALQEIEHARHLDPLSPSLAVHAALLYRHARQLDRSLTELQGIQAVHPHHPLVLQALAATYGELGRWRDAVASARVAVQRSSRNPSAVALLGFLLARMGENAEARQLQRESDDSAERQYVSPFSRALLAIALNEPDKALALLEQAYQERDAQIFWIAVDQRLEPLHHLPRFAVLRQQIASVPVVRTPAVAARRVPWLWISAASLLVLLILSWLPTRTEKSPDSFASARIEKLTTDGAAATAAISPDGKYVAYALREPAGQSLWVRQSAVSGGVRILPPRTETIRSLTFARDGLSLYYVLSSQNNYDHSVVWQAPVLGGLEKQVIADVRGPIALAPDGSQIAFIRTASTAGEDQLFTAQIDGTQERLLLSRRHPARFVWSSAPAWAPDGNSITVAEEHLDSGGAFSLIMSVDRQTAATRILSPRRWTYLEQMAWLPNGRGLLLIGHEESGSFQQIWLIPPGGGKERRLTSDLSDYNGLSITADSHSLVTTQTVLMSGITLASAAHPEQGTQLTSGAGRYFDLSWGPGKQIFFASDASGSADLWAVGSDGSRPRQLTANLHRNYSPASNAQSPYVLFHSNRSGSWNIWRMNPDGSSPRQLTFDHQDSNWPELSRDGKWVIYQHMGADAQFHLWRVPIDGGSAQQLTQAVALHPAVSPLDGKIACWYYPGEKMASRLAILPPDGGEPLKMFPHAPTVSIDSSMRWTPGGDNITYIDYAAGVANLWQQPVSGDTPKALTHFQSGFLFSLDWSSDGKLAYSRGTATTDVVRLVDLP